jgi:hypothetical protein
VLGTNLIRVKSNYCPNNQPMPNKVHQVKSGKKQPKVRGELMATSRMISEAYHKKFGKTVYRDRKKQT